MFQAIAWTVAFAAILAIGAIFGSVLIRRGGSDCVLGWALVAIIAAMPILHAVGACVNDGPSMNYLGWVYWTDWGRTPEVGEVFRFVPADQPAWTKYFPRSTWVKRCVDITPEGLYVFEGDNTEWSTDNRDKLEPVSADRIAGTIWGATHPSRVLRWFEPKGRLKNWVQMRYGPNRCWERNTGFVLLHGNRILHLSVEGWRYIRLGEDDFPPPVVPEHVETMIERSLTSSIDEPIALGPIDHGRVVEHVDVPEGTITVILFGRSDGVTTIHWGRSANPPIGVFVLRLDGGGEEMTLSIQGKEGVVSSLEVKVIHMIQGVP